MLILYTTAIVLALRQRTYELDGIAWNAVDCVIQIFHKYVAPFPVHFAMIAYHVQLAIYHVT